MVLCEDDERSFGGGFLCCMGGGGEYEGGAKRDLWERGDGRELVF